MKHRVARRVLRTWIRIAAVVSVVAAATHVVAIVAAKRALARATDEWVRAFGPIAPLEVDEPANESAQRLNALIVLMSGGPSGEDGGNWASYSNPCGRDWSDIQRRFDELRKSAGPSRELPAELLIRLHATEPELAAVVSFLAAEAAPRSAKGLPLGGIARLHAALVARAVLLAERGNVPAAEESLDAAWRLAEDARSRGHVYGLLVAWSLARRQLDATAMIEPPLPRWPRWIDEIPDEPELLAATIREQSHDAHLADVELWRQEQAIRRSLYRDLGAVAPPSVYLPAWLVRPWEIAAAARNLDTHRRIQLDDADLPTDRRAIAGLKHEQEVRENRVLTFSPLEAPSRASQLGWRLRLLETQEAIDRCRAHLAGEMMPPATDPG